MSAKIYDFTTKNSERAYQLAQKWGEAAHGHATAEVYTAISMMLANLDLMGLRSSIDELLPIMGDAVRQYREQLIRAGYKQGERP